MTPELDIQLVETCPHLYASRYRPMQETAMCWGFECGDGWFDLIWELSRKLEKIIVAEINDGQYKQCWNCGHEGEEHYIVGGCTAKVIKCIVPLPRFRPIWWKKANWIVRLKTWKNSLHWKIWRLADRLGLHYKVKCGCENYEPSHFRASQVKEKYGGLRFYLHGGASKAVWKLIEEAEAASYKICEDCGAPGKVRDGGWVRTLCDECNEKR